MASFDEYYDLRRRICDALAEDVHGPTDHEEIIPDPPLTRYLTGILFPQDSDVTGSADENTGALAEGEETADDPPVALTGLKFPSSMGMTFAVDSRTAPVIAVLVTAARYAPQTSDTTAETSKGEQRWADWRAGKSETSPWRRQSIRSPIIDVNVTQPESGAWRPIADGLQLFCRVRPADDDGKVSVTLILVNRNQAPVKGWKDEVSFFQPELRVTGIVPGTIPFVGRSASSAGGEDEDRKSYLLLYRYRSAMAVGHGCSVGISPPGDLTRAVEVYTTYLPTYELQLAESNNDIRIDGLSIQWLGKASRAVVIEQLGKLCDGYDTWLQARHHEAEDLPRELQATAADHLHECRSALLRMREGIGILENDDVVWRAFQLANRAMQEQRARTSWHRAGYPPPGPDRSELHEWRPFQLAFILLCVKGIAQPESDDRKVADLLWFPTGGGKTEAYLGIIALCLFLRRLRHGHKAGGVTVIMRYTLRLLTIQQFERAALLICCCEALRASDPGLGDAPISIGLWVGGRGTPNTLKEARIALDKLRTGSARTSEMGNPMQVRVCPWCGHGLTASNYYIRQTQPRMVIACKQSGCTFKEGLPIHLIDEDVYNSRPSLLIGTADKFAALPWRERTAALFALDKDNDQPPDLIIQDELHLISGPLGTLAGLYETAVDLLCSRRGAVPKVIASTATIRRAQTQGHRLFARTVKQFPPPGLDARDSYFAKEASPNTKGTRLYVGLMAPGSQTTLLVRTYAALLQRVDELHAADEVKDPYWTLLGYFNSLRVLAGARMQVQDDVTDRMKLLATMSGREPRNIDRRIELTSREPSGDIPQHLKDMALSYPDPDTLSVLLATNMISVGVDIDRLGLMVVMGQPQGTSEYIQATSRVGRKYPGLVLTLFNSSRSRDRSHYEGFVDYHSALYRQVEAVSVTPFSSRARDRGLHAVVIALVRLLYPALRANDTAGDIDGHAKVLTEVKSMILRRVEEVAPGELAATEAHLNGIADRWMQRARNEAALHYENNKDHSEALLVSADGSLAAEEDPFPTLWSLRDVDASPQLYQVR